MADRLQSLARAVAARAHSPYSGRPHGAALRLADGRTVAAPRVESAAFPLTVPALQGAWALAALAGSLPVSAALSRPFTPGELGFLEEIAPGWRRLAPDLAVRRDSAAGSEAVSFELTPPATLSLADGVALALTAAGRAVVPASNFRVGAVVEDVHGRLVAAANVEHPADWTRGLCAERVALVAARAAGLGPVRRLHLACVTAPGGTPCGGCRQLIAELAPDAEIVIGRGDAPPDVTTPLALLPGAFVDASLGR